MQNTMNAYFSINYLHIKKADFVEILLSLAIDLYIQKCSLYFDILFALKIFKFGLVLRKLWKF
jgi:hypothetical protein